LIFKRSEWEKTLEEANSVSDRLKTSLSFSLSATKTLAFVVEKNGTPDDFNSIAANILKSNKYIDALELTRKGVITHVYPLEGNASVIGFDILADSATSIEAIRALTQNELFFAGPLELMQGGTGVVGRLPIFRDGNFWGFSVVLIKLPTLLKAAGIENDSNKNYGYQLSKRNPVSGKEEFFLPGPVSSLENHVSIEVPDGEWKLYVFSEGRSGYLSYIFPFAVLGLVLSVTGGLFAWQFARQPEKLKRRVDKVTAEIIELQKSSRESLEKVNRLYHFTSRINHMMVHVNNEKKMYSEVCQIAFDIGGFRMAWIGLIDPQVQQLIPVCSAGDNQGYLSAVTPISLLPEDVEGPAKKLIRTEVFVHCNDIATDPLMTPWAKHALEQGYQSLILLPIKKFGKVIGSFCLFSEEKDCFDDNEIQLLQETANNISFTLENFENESRRRMAEEQIQSEKMLSDSIINSLPGIFYLYDRKGKFFRWNKNFEEVSGYSAEQIKSMHPLDFFEGSHKTLIKNKIDEVFANGYAEVVADYGTRDYGDVPYFFNGKKVTFNGIDYLIGMGLDITDRVKAENALLERTEEIEKLSAHLQNIREEERSKIALEIHDVLGQQLTAIKMDSTWLRKRYHQDIETAERVGSMIALIDDTIKTIRRIATELRPGILDDLGLVAALEWQGSEFAKNTGIQLQFGTNKNDLELERNFSTNIFRIYQEALTNIARHADATEVSAEFVHRDDFIELIIKDNGRGIDLNEIKKKKSLGLISMKERARLFHGDVRVESIFPHGTAVILRVPLERKGNTISI
jgi:PAS domain S-box-containing protein